MDLVARYERKRLGGYALIDLDDGERCVGEIVWTQGLGYVTLRDGQPVATGRTIVEATENHKAKVFDANAERAKRYIVTEDGSWAKPYVIREAATLREVNRYDVRYWAYELCRVLNMEVPS